MSGPQLQPPDPWATAYHAKFSERVALLPQYQFDGDNKKGGAWRGVVRPYLVSRAPEMEALPLSVETSED